MNILLVDDDQYLLESIKSMVNWAAVGIDGVYSAGLVSTARKILCSEPIDLMLCDIEMAQENGLELIAWCRENGLDMEVVILSSYAKFEYAQKAIQLDSTDYLLKPVSYPKLEQTLSNMVAGVNKKREQKDAIAVGKKTKVMLRNLQWKWYVEQLRPDKAFEEEYEQWYAGLEQNIPGRCRLLILDNPEYENGLEAEKKGMEDYSIRELFTQLEARFPYRLKGVFRTGGHDAQHHIAVVEENEDCGCIRAYVCELLRSLERLFERSYRCYVGEPVSVDKLPGNLKQIYRMVEDTIAENERIYFLESYIWKQIPYVEPAFLEWKLMILNGSGRQAVQSIGDDLDRQIAKQGLNSKNVQRFLLSFQYMLFEVLKEKQVLVRCIDEELSKDTFSAKTFYSLASLKQYVTRIITQTCKLIAAEQENCSVIQTVVAYIDEHLGEDLNRDTFTDIVYLNPNYMARLFKKEMGMSLGNYLMQQRVERAKYLLEHTGISINLISSQVGYDNFSYFSKVFRRLTGLSPNEYRKKLGKRVCAEKAES